MTNQSRQGRGNGNGGQKYRESSFWGNLDKSKKAKGNDKDDSKK